MLTRIHIMILIGTAAALWAACLWVLGLPLAWEYSKPFSAVVAALTALTFAFDRWAWKWPVFQGWLVKRPWLEGTWKVELVSNHVLEGEAKPIEPISAVLAVRQSFSKLSARLMTSESSSRLVASSLIECDDGEFEFSAVYHNEPSVVVRDRSPIHYGAFKLRVPVVRPANVAGHYWTDRGTTGTMQLELSSRMVSTSFEDGMKTEC